MVQGTQTWASPRQLFISPLGHSHPPSVYSANRGQHQAKTHKKDTGRSEALQTTRAPDRACAICTALPLVLHAAQTRTVDLLWMNPSISRNTTGIRWCNFSYHVERSIPWFRTCCRHLFGSARPNSIKAGTQRRRSAAGVDHFHFKPRLII